MDKVQKTRGFQCYIPSSEKNLHRLKTEGEPSSETLRFLYFTLKTMDKVQKTSDFHCYIPSSEPFRIQLNMF
jgi:hypothetical protein